MKRIIALILCIVSVAAILCSCRIRLFPDEFSYDVPNLDISSVAAESEVTSDKTSSISDEEISSEDETFSNSASADEESSDTALEDEDTESVSTSSSVKLPNLDRSTVEIGCFQFTPYYCINYTDEYVAKNDGNMDVPFDTKLEEFEDVLAEGYFNTVFLNHYDIANEKIWQIIEKYNVKVWMMTASGYKSSSGKTIDEYMKSHLKPFDFIKDNPKRWALFNGVAYDEMIHRGYAPEDFSLMAEYLYKKLGKRCFPVMAPQEFTKLWWDGQKQQQTTEGCKYFTDIAFDMYDGNVQLDATPNIAGYASALYPEYNIQNDEDVYKMMTSEMLKLVDHPVNVWFYPSSHKKSEMHTESYCLAQLIFFEELLKEQKHPGGIVLYTYAQSNDYNFGLASFLDLGGNGGKTIRRFEGQVWRYYSTYLKRLTAQYRKTPNKPYINLG